MRHARPVYEGCEAIRIPTRSEDQGRRVGCQSLQLEELECDNQRMDVMGSGPESTAAPLPAERVNPPVAERAGVTALVSILAGTLWLVYHSPNAISLLCLIFLHMLITAVCLGAYLVAAAALRLKIDEISLFFGGYVLRFQIKACWIVLNWVPLGGSVKFSGQHDEPAKPTVSTTSNGLRQFTETKPWERLLLCLAPIVFGSAVALEMLGSGETLRLFPRIFGVLVQTMVAPRLVGSPALAHVLNQVANGQYRRVIGELAIENVAASLFPLSMSNGGMVLIELIQIVIGRRLSARTMTILQCLSLLVGVWMFISWCIALNGALPRR
jgi:membrane-associated protease RseP (regulator of RpoE activity)